MKYNNTKVIGRLLGLVRALWALMIVAVLMGSLGFVAAIAVPMLGSYGILLALDKAVSFSMTAIIGLLLLCVGARSLLRYAEQATNHYIAFKLLAIIRDKVFQALRRLAPAKLEGRDKGNLISIITTDIELLEVFYAHTISPVCIAIVVSAMMLSYFFSFHPLLALIALAAYLSVGVVVPVLASRAGRNLGQEYRDDFGKLNSYVLESLRGLNESIQYAQAEQRLQEMNEATQRLAAKQRRLVGLEGNNTGITNSIILIFSLSIFFVAMLLHQQGSIGFEAVLLSTVAMMSSFGPVVALAGLANNLYHTFASGRRVLEILDESPKVAEVSDGKDLGFVGAAFDNVSFAYAAANGEASERILNEISLSIPEDRIIGISGRSGSGKSTLLRLLMRFWDADSGSIRISGSEIKQINTSALREMESFVTQETCLFHDTIENNIRIAKLDASRQEVIEACKKASIHDFIISLPFGYDTQVGELGETLSGGERQRLGLARAFLHEAPLILLDEPTSNLDSLNEAVILKSLNEEGQGRTVVLVSHRQSTMRIADKVYSVENGRVS